MNNMCNLFTIDRTKEFKTSCDSFLSGSVSSAQYAQNDAVNDTVNEDEYVMINLLPVIEDSSTVRNDNNDMWLQFANDLYQSIDKMASWLDSKVSSYCRVHDQLSSYDIDMTPSHGGKDANHRSNDGANDIDIFETSVTDFVKSYTNQIQSLSKSLQSNFPSANKDSISHRNGIISHLVTQLQVLIVDKFADMQRVRNRKSLELWNNPLRTVMAPTYVAKLNSSLLFEPDQNDRWKNMASQVDDDAFLATYVECDALDNELKDLASLDLSTLQICPVVVKEEANVDTFQHSNPGNDREATTHIKISQSTTTTLDQGMKSSSIQYTNTALSYDDNEVEMNHIEELQKESAYLKARIESTQLDSVQKVEGQMMQITSLLSQFSSLVSEQQEEISNIHDIAIQSKANMVKGNEQLVDAAERKKKSKHYFSIVIYSMALILLVLNWIIP